MWFFRYSAWEDATLSDWQVETSEPRYNKIGAKRYSQPILPSRLLEAMVSDGNQYRDSAIKDKRHKVTRTQPRIGKGARAAL